MRPLSLTEYQVLRDLAAGIERCWTEDDPCDADLSEIQSALLTRGCVSMIEAENDDETRDEFPFVEVYDITDLGHLALRVSRPFLDM